jgi:hypothetical protein
MNPVASSKARLGARAAIASLVALACLALAAVLWGGLLHPWMTRVVSRALGRPVALGKVSLRFGAVVARDVRVFGAPPFESEPFAYVDRMTVRFRPATPWTIRRIEVDGADVSYLGAERLENVRSPSAPHIGSARETFAPEIVVRDARLRGLYVTAGEQRLAFRAARLSLTAHGRSQIRAQLEGVVVEVHGIATFAIPSLDVAGAGTTIRAGGRGGALRVPGGGTLVEGLAIETTVDPARSVDLRARRAPEGSSRDHTRLDLRAHLGADAIRGDVDVSGLALEATRPLLARAGLDPTGATLSLRLRGERPRGGGAISFGLDASLEGLTVSHAAIDDDVWRGISGSAALRGEIDVPSRRLLLTEGRVEALGWQLGIAGWLALAGPARGELTIKTPAPLPCAPLLAAQPEPIRRSLTGLGLAGQIGASVRVTFDARRWDDLGLDLAVVPVCRVVSEPAALTALRPALDAPRGDAAASAKLPVVPGHPDFVSLARIPKHVVDAFVTAEDGRFFSHKGFDPETIRRALAHDLQVAGFAKGASTITQQLAKNVFLTPGRTLARKLEESVFAWRLEEQVGKTRILELYLNVIELGPGIRGVRQAAKAYFGKEPGALSPLEAAHLASLPPNPVGFARRFKDGRVDEGWLHRLYELLAMMNRSGRLSAAELAAARGMRLTLRPI